MIGNWNKKFINGTYRKCRELQGDGVVHWNFKQPSSCNVGTIEIGKARRAQRPSTIFHF